MSSLPALAGVWLWEAFGKDLAKDAVQRAARSLWTNFNWLRAADRYRESLYEQYREIQIFGQPEPVPLEGIFTHLYILDRPRALARYDVDALIEAVQQDQGRFHDAEGALARPAAEWIDGLDLVTAPEGSECLFILGKPGAGKTTFLKHLALQAVKGRLDRIPIFVSLKEWADSGLDLLPFIAGRFEICDFPDAQPFVEHALRQGQALVLFDGLDEVTREARERTDLISALVGFCVQHQYRKSQCVITCRTAATDYTFQGFKYVEVADFSAGQMHAFVRKWFRDDADMRDRFWEEFQKEEHRGLRELGCTPLLFTLLCLAFQETLSFPWRRVEIYEEAIDALLKKWDASRRIMQDETYRRLSLERKRQMFTCIAAETFEHGDYFLRQDDLEGRIVAYMQRLPAADEDEDVDGTAVLKEIEARHGIFVERARRVYAFAHLTFQEYFTARHVVDDAASGSIPRLLSHCTDARWREIILLTASMLHDADDFFAEFRKAVDELVADDEQLVAFLSWVSEKAASVRTRYKQAAVRSYYAALALDLTLDLYVDLYVDLYCNLDRDLTRDRDLCRDLYLVRARGPYRARALDLYLVRARDRARHLYLDRARHLHLVRDFTLSITFAPELYLDRVYVLDLDFTCDLTRDLYLYLVLDLVLDLARDLDHVRDHDLYLDRARDLYLTRDRDLYLDLYLARDLARDLDSDLHSALVGLEPPGPDALLEVWQAFEKQLRAIMITHRNIGHEWYFSEEQYERLQQYFQANRLLVACLELASVSDRAAIEDSLLLPPEAQSPP